MMKKSQKVTSRTAESLRGNDSEGAVENPWNRKRLADSAHALLCSLNLGRFATNLPSSLPLRHREYVVISTARIDGEASPHKSNCWLLRCVGPEQSNQRRFITPVVTTGVAEDFAAVYSGDV